MQLQFDTTECAYLKQIVSQAQKQEQTQEIRLTDDMPDIGRILGCWGQTMIRSKEWRSGEIGASGGVKIWVLYCAENEQVHCIDTWIPFQMRWPIPDTQRDGQIHLQPYLQELECRSIGARKMMIRMSVCVHAKAYEQAREQIAVPPNMPEHVYIRRRSYPMELSVEAGEKPFAINDDFTLGEGAAPVAKIVRFEILPQIREHKVLSGKVIFRGGYSLHMLYLCPEGKLHRFHGEGGFSQFADLDKDYSTAATVNASLLLTLADLDVNEQGALQLKCGFACQYLIFDRTTVEIADDAYSPECHVKLQMQQLELPVRLDSVTHQIPYSADYAVDAHRIIDESVNWHMPMFITDEERVNVQLQGNGQLLYINEQGHLEGAAASLKEQWSMLSDPGNRIDGMLVIETCDVSVQPEGVQIEGNVSMELSVASTCGIPMITGMELGEKKSVDPERPSVILRRVGSDSLWDIAKAYDSSVESIYEANGLECEPMPDKMLLIPIN